jgi:hypothetical protein
VSRKQANRNRYMGNKRRREQRYKEDVKEKYMQKWNKMKNNGRK